MNDLTDQQLLRDYSDRRSEQAFAELVRRHVDFVYSAAVRMLRDTHLAEDVTQGVFVALARSASQLTDHPTVSGWLHRTAQNLAAKVIRTDVRRRAREQEAVLMNALLTEEPDQTWEGIAPHLDAAMGELEDSDRDALFLRYFERKTAREMAQSLGISDEAAQKRVSRAADRLRESFARRGVTVGAGGLVVLITANGIQAAPAGLAVAISTAALAGTAVTAASVLTTVTTIAMTTLQKTLITTALAVAAGAGIYEAHQASTLRDQVQSLQQQQAPLAGQLAQLQAENTRLSNQVAEAKDQKSLSQAQFSELLRLRGQTSQTRSVLQELAKLKSTPPPSGMSPAYNALFTNAMVQGMSMGEKIQKKLAMAKLGRMTQQLQLTDSQQESISNLMIKNIEDKSPLVMNALLGKQPITPDQLAALAPTNEEVQIKAQLTSEQLAAYPDFMQAEAATAADNSAKSEVSTMTAEMDLSQEQQDKIHSALYQLNLSQGTTSQDKAAAVQAVANGQYADFLNSELDKEKQHLADKVNALSGILTPDQLKIYQQKQQDTLDVEAGAMKMFLPQTNNAVAQ